MHIASLFAALSLAVLASGCADSSSLLVDRMGVSDAKYNQDLANCKSTSAPVSVSLSNPIATCMSAKGYKVLMGK